ncbi:MAG TPA: alpha/beta fold hydrolase [Thermoleophilaceae bacterium]|nr:alpha/beta fold hydrolase [Thermoleophilaceae bacterium]
MRVAAPNLPINRPPMWREARVGLETASLLRHPVFRGEGVAHGRGQPVMLIPGFLAGDGSLAVMANWLRRTGHWTTRAGMLANVDCSAAALGRLELRLERLVERQGRRAAIVGQSRGGSLARALAHRRPDLVAGLVTLGTPQIDPFAVHPLVRLQMEALSRLGGLGAPRLFTRTCLDGECCEDFWRGMAEPLESHIGFVAVYSRSDGIVSWESCLDPHADDHVEISASHIGMAVNPAAYQAVASALAGFRAAERASSRRGRARLSRAA